MMKKTRIVITKILLFILIMSNLNSAFAQNITTEQRVDKSINQAIEYLHNIQNNDGGFPTEKGKPSSTAMTSWVIMTLRAAGENITNDTWTKNNKNPIDFMEEKSNKLESTTDYARTILALTATDQPLTYNGENILNKISSFQQPNGAFLQSDQGEEGMINAHMWSILAIASKDNDIPNKQKAKEWLISKQNEDGGFSWLEGADSDCDDTGVAIQTLILLGENPKTSKVIKKAVDYLKSYQQQDGGFSTGSWMGKDTNIASTSWAIQGIIASGETPSNDNISYILSLQQSDGSFNWKKGTSSIPAQMTSYAIIALKQKPFPVNIQYKQYIMDHTKFTDLNSKHWAYTEIMNLVGENVLTGYTDNTFRPEKPVTRAEFAKFIACALEIEDTDTNKTFKFTDVSKTHWAYQYIKIGINKGYINGRTEQIFDPNGKITGAELATILVRNLPADKKTNIQSIEGSYWYSGYVKIAEQNKLLYPDFNATKIATRAQCAYSVMQLKKSLER